MNQDSFPSHLLQVFSYGISLLVSQFSIYLGLLLFGVGFTSAILACTGVLTKNS